MPSFRRPIFPRRRRAGRLRRRWRPMSPAARRALRQLQRAHELMAMGNSAEAAAIFEELAETAKTKNLKRTPQLYLQAGRAWIEAGQSEHGLDLLIRALQSMVDMGQFQRIPRISRRVLENLRSKGMEKIARSYEAKANEILAAHGLTIDIRVELAPTPHLPAKCSYCGGNVHPEEVEWSGEYFAACAYCGSQLEIGT